MKYISAKLSLMKALGRCTQDKALNFLNTLSGVNFAGRFNAMQACIEGRFISRTLSCRAGVRDVEPVKRHCKGFFL
jgi:hypothetical protein